MFMIYIFKYRNDDKPRQTVQAKSFWEAQHLASNILGSLNTLGAYARIVNTSDEGDVTCVRKGSNSFIFKTVYNPYKDIAKSKRGKKKED